jgi:hypothetical protein
MASVAFERNVSITGIFAAILLIGREVAIFEKIGNERVEAIDRNEFLREVEGRAEMIDASVG